MGNIWDDEIESVPRRTMVLFFLIDTSGSMAGGKIDSLNVAVQEVLPTIKDISDNNADAEIKVAALEFSSGTEWMYNQPESMDNFVWRDVEAGGLTDMGEAFTELSNKLSVSKGFMAHATGSFAPVIILFSDGEPTDDYKRGLEKLEKNNWYKAAIKIAIAIGEDANQDILAEFTHNKEAVLTVHTKEQLKRIIHFVTVTSTQVASTHTSVGTNGSKNETESEGENETKQNDVIDQLKEGVQNNPGLEGVNIGDLPDAPGTWDIEDW